MLSVYSLTINIGDDEVQWLAHWLCSNVVNRGQGLWCKQAKVYSPLNTSCCTSQQTTPLKTTHNEYFLTFNH